MKYYVVAEVSVTNPQWVPVYLAKVNQIVQIFGGKYLARTGEYEMVEGDMDRHQTSIIMEFPTKDAAYGFYNSKEYKPLRDARKAGSISKLYIVAGEDVAKN